MKNAFLFVCLGVIVASLGSAASAVTIDTVPVGNVGNIADSTGYGAVDYEYNIGKYEVTAGQYTDFLNAADPTGANIDGLYNTDMTGSIYGCQITWNSGSSTYDFSGKPSGTAADWQDRPVNFISWYDAAMFANWATSGNIHQGAYDTSAAANWGSSTANDYTGITAHDSAAMDVLVSTYGTVVVLPTENEWYKAAYYDSGASSYYDYPTGSDTLPGYVNDGGELSGTGNPFTQGGSDPGNYASYDFDNGPVTSIGSPYFRTIVGEWENSDSPYGTFDQGGNVWEWNETLLGSSRGVRGGTAITSFYLGNLHASGRGLCDPTFDIVSYGFRVATTPEPATLTFLALGGLAVLRKRRKQ